MLNAPNFLNFKNIGLDTLSESSAFTKIRNSSKFYTSNLLDLPSSANSKYRTLSNLYIDDGNYLQTSSFALKRQHNLTSASSIGSTPSINCLDSNGLSSFLFFNQKLNEGNLVPSTSLSSTSLSSPKDSPLPTAPNLARLSTFVSLNNYLTAPLGSVVFYPSTLANFGDNSDSRGLSYPIFKLVDKGLMSSTPLNYAQSVTGSSVTDLSASSNLVSAHKILNASSSSKT